MPPLDFVDAPNLARSNCMRRYREFVVDRVRDVWSMGEAAHQPKMAVIGGEERHI